MRHAGDPQRPATGASVPDSDLLFRSLFVASPDAMLLVDGDGQIMLSNPAAARLLGYANEELLGMSVDALVPQAIRPRHQAYRHAYAQQPVARPMGTQMELVARRRDGSEVMVEIALSPLQDHGLPYVVASIRGIADFPRVKQALQRARYSELIARMGSLAVDTRDPEMLLHQVPAVACEGLQIDAAVAYLLDAGRQEFTVASVIGLGDTFILGSKVANRPDFPAGFVLAQGVPVVTPDYASEARFSGPPALRQQGFVSGMGVPFSDRGQIIGVLGVHSRRHRPFSAEEQGFLQSLANLLASSLQRAQTEAALSHTQRLESVGQLTGGIAHDFNNLLTVIQGNLQVLEDHPAVASDEDAVQMLAAATRASRRGGELTAKLLAFSRRQVLRPSHIDLSALLPSLTDMLARTLDQRIRIECHVPQALHCLADAGQLDAALLNLAINARDAMPGGGTLRLSCRPCEPMSTELATELMGDLVGETRGEVNAGLGAGPAGQLAAQGYVEIEVADSGRGMTEAVRQRAFEPFFTTKEAGRGTGLGLSTVYGFVKQSRGAVRLHTVLGQGTRVSLVLPRYLPGEGQGHEAAPRQAALPKGLKVLLVEDEAEVRAVVRKQLLALGCRVTECASAEQALERLLAVPDQDLLLSDMALGAGLSGAELARRAQARWPRLARLLMSGYSGEFLDEQDASPLGAELLHKPFDRSQLAQAMLRALTGVNAGAGPPG